MSASGESRPHTPDPGDLAAEQIATAPEHDEEVRAYLWDMEHHANVLGRYGFGDMRSALLSDEVEALRRMVAS